MDAKKEIQEIKEFRKKHKNECVSTSHTYTFSEFMEISFELKKEFKKFSVFVTEEKVTVRIPIK